MRLRRRRRDRPIPWLRSAFPPFLRSSPALVPIRLPLPSPSSDHVLRHYLPSSNLICRTKVRCLVWSLILRCFYRPFLPLPIFPAKLPRSSACPQSVMRNPKPMVRSPKPVVRSPMRVMLILLVTLSPLPLPPPRIPWTGVRWPRRCQMRACMCIGWRAQDNGARLLCI